MTLLLDPVQEAEAVLLTALKQLIPCEFMAIQTLAAHRLQRELPPPQIYPLSLPSPLDSSDELTQIFGLNVRLW